ncbi:MAG: hypothetical protein KC431_21915, partial [Myxococcales bacterium]|nr:hypothetical protein [Myxococcales bacterium]
MSTQAHPWQPERSRMALPGRVVVRVAAGEGPERVPHYLDVARGLASAPVFFDGGPVERVLRRFSPALRVTRAFRAARGGLEDRPRWDATEDHTGLAWTYRVEIDPHADLVAVVQELSAASAVERATPHYLSVTPFAGAHAQTGSSNPEVDPGYGHALIGATEALRFEPGDAGLIVGIVDSGLKSDHQEF